MEQNSLSATRADSFYSHNISLLIVAAALSVVGIHNNGAAALLQLLVCTLTTVISEGISFRLIGKKGTLKDLSAVVTGMIIALMLPASAPLYVSASAGAFAIIAAKLPFGDARHTPFVPAAAGLCFAAALFSNEVFTFPDPSGELYFYGSESFSAARSLSDMLRDGDSINLNVFSAVNLLSGSYPGAIGTTSVLALVGAAIFLCLREKKRLLSSLGFVAAGLVFAFLFPRISSSRLTSIIMELSSGGLLFTALMLIPDPATAPKDSKKAFLYGLVGGTFCMLLRYFSKTPDPSFFSVLLLNAVSPVFFGTVTEKGGRKK